ncbi:hypothetical protein DEA8626_00261 [Defluviimonas aquaemixtae]|uniref:Thiamine diphosphokinase n=1 Tax=Albidovulum aquaemixtae TaxID=1542388 RepID=A0A2R8B2I0_9RHOB|nr:thiamine diphosphokinase [Defluviimonas aquaemixtae]SPH16750.1 hypothetical protein DEA8626_00261 [Defluviimonas aquaemixtae]
MKKVIVHSKLPVTLIGAGAFSQEFVKEALRHAPCLVAADGGVNVAVAMGLVPEAVIGDLDSASEAALSAVPKDQIWPVKEQDTTDFEKCLARIKAPVILAVGFAGSRLDHLLAVFAALARYPGCNCVVIGDEDVIFLAPRVLSLDLPAGTRVSLFPLGPVTGRSEGLEWPIAGIEFAPDGRIGTSNRVTGPVTLSFDAEKMLVLLPRDCLVAAIEALVPAD